MLFALVVVLNGMMVTSAYDDAELRAQLTPVQYQCTQKDGTETPFHNKYWDNHKDGIYVDVVSGQPLFSSIDKYDSGSGWPSFTQPIKKDVLTFREDHKLGVERTEVRSKKANSHLGHVFDDGPGPTHKRYCINSASLRFVPVDRLKSEGYGRYLFEFTQKKDWQIATLAGGCFWGMQQLLQKIPGVIETQTGYATDQGHPSDSKVDYDKVKTGKTSYAEAVQVLFDPKKVSYEDVLLQFFKMHDPTTLDRQENDIGEQYRSEIFIADEAQKKTALAVKERVEKSGQWKKSVVTEIAHLTRFVRAEDFHQDYLTKHPNGYTCHYIRKMEF